MTDPDHPPGPDLDAEAILAVLERHRVDYVVIGGYAAALRGSSRPTRDIDVVPSTSTENLQRLAVALRELGARIRTEAAPEGLPFTTSAEALRGARILNLVTPLGEVDLTFTPSGTTGYDDLARSATALPVGTLTVRVASLDDVIRSKQAAGRPKDLRALPELVALASRRHPPAGPGTGTAAAALSYPTPVPEVPTPAADGTGASLGGDASNAAAARVAAARAQAAVSRQGRNTGGNKRG